ncbi:MAG: PadR family transcriptional regulator [Alphaproteobacteria bacterium]|nr:PadR family transcriptional regulator [Alphaproteobacteria bacterium]
MDTKTLCLGILSLGDATGYEIKKQFEDGPFSHFYKVGFGAIYPALNELSAQGLATVTQHAQENRPDKKVYAITPAGRRSLVQGLIKRPGPDQIRSEFLFIVAFGTLLPSALVAAMIEERLAWHRGEAARIGELVADDQVPPGRRFVRGFGLAVHQAAIRYIEENRGMIAGDPPHHDEAAQ